MPRKQPVNIHDELVRHCMEAPIEQVAQLLATATAIVKIRSQQASVATPKAALKRPQRPPVGGGNPPPPPAGTTTGFATAPGPKAVETAGKAPKPPALPKPPVKPPTAADKVDLAAARERANQATGVVTQRAGGPRKLRPPVGEAAGAAAPAGDPIPPVLPPQTVEE